MNHAEHFPELHGSSIDFIQYSLTGLPNPMQLTANQCSIIKSLAPVPLMKVRPSEYQGKNNVQNLTAAITVA